MEAVVCPSCGHSDDYWEFADPECDAPDLANALSCPACDHFWDSEDDA